MRDVADRPEPLARKAFVVALTSLLRHPPPPQRVTGMIGRNAQAVVRVYELAIRAAGTMRHPRPVARPEDRLDRRHQPTRGNDDIDAFVPLVEDVHVRLAVRDHKEGAFLKLFAQADAQALRRPERGV